MNENKFFFYAMKCLIIFYICSVFSMIALFFSFYLNKYLQKNIGDLKKKYKKCFNKNIVLRSVIIEMGIIGVFAYLVRFIMKNYLPEIFNGKYGINYSKFKELNGGVVVAFSFFLFTGDVLKEKINYLYKDKN